MMIDILIGILSSSIVALLDRKDSELFDHEKKKLIEIKEKCQSGKSNEQFLRIAHTIASKRSKTLPDDIKIPFDKDDEIRNLIFNLILTQDDSIKNLIINKLIDTPAFQKNNIDFNQCTEIVNEIQELIERIIYSDDYFKISFLRNDHYRIIDSMKLMLHQQGKTLEVVEDLNAKLKSVNAINEKSQDSGLGSYDCTRKPNHFFLFPSDRKKIEEVYVEPDYDIFLYENGDFKKSPSPTEDIVSTICKNLKSKRIIFITGQYGTGKTILSKNVQKRLIDQSYDTIFLNAYELIHFTPDYGFIMQIKDRKVKDIPLVIFIDAFDEIIHIESKKSLLHKQLLKNIFKSLHQHDHIYFIINFRSIKLEKSSICEEINYIALDQAGINSVLFLQCLQFSNGQIDKWLSNYYFILARDEKIDYTLSRNDLKKDTAKGFYDDCKTPLFLYIVTNSYYKNHGIKSINDIYLLYSDFVENTIKGKYEDDKRVNAENYKIFHKHYEAFFESMAIFVAKENSRIDNHNVTIDVQTEWHLEENEKLNCVTEMILDEQIGIIAKNISNSLGIFGSDQIDQVRLKENALNCYFFTLSNEKYCFRENNVSSFLLARSLFKRLKNASSSVAIEYNLSKSFSEFFNEIVIFQDIIFSTVSIEFLFHLINSLDKNEKKNLREFLSVYIQDNFDETIKNNAYKVKYIKGYNVNILMYLLMLKLNVIASDRERYIKKIVRYFSITKHISRESYWVAQRFFKELTFQDFALYRVSLSGFNLSRTELINTQFNQVAFNLTIFCNNLFKNTVFKLCYINFKILNGKGDLKITNCQCKQLNIENPNGLCIFINSSHINEIIINHKETGKANKAISLILENVTVTKIIIRDIKSNNMIYIKESKIDSFNGLHSLLNINCDSCDIKVPNNQINKINVKKTEFDCGQKFEEIKSRLAV